MCFGSIINVTSRINREGKRHASKERDRYSMICLNLCERARRRRTYLFRTYRFHASASEAHAITAVESTDPSQSKNCFAPRTAGVWVLAKRWHDFASKEFHRFFDFFMRDAAKIEGCG